jgi:hypothetical protein
MYKIKKMKNSTLILLGLVGVGIYLYMRNKKANASYYPTAPNPAAPVNDTGVPPVTSTGEEIPQTLDAKGNVIETYNVRYAISGYKKKLGKIPNTI